MSGFADRLAEAIDATGSPVCVGLDPVLDRLPGSVRSGASSDEGAIEAFCEGVLGAVAGVVPVVKVQAACFERYGSSGWAVLERVVGVARERGLLVVLDAKRGDIGLTAGHYAAGVSRLGADAVTVSPYLGTGTLVPFMEAGLGVFVLVRTSNPEGDGLQTATLEDGSSVASLVGGQVASLGEGAVGRRGLSDVGAVVGLTKAEEGALLRGVMPDQVFLLPGYGAQGGDAAGLSRLVRAGAGSVGEAGVLVTASRSVIYAGGTGEGWASSVREAAEGMAGGVRRAVGFG